jgi:hypothetical protein
MASPISLQATSVPQSINPTNNGSYYVQECLLHPIQSVKVGNFSLKVHKHEIIFYFFYLNQILIWPW